EKHISHCVAERHAVPQHFFIAHCSPVDKRAYQLLPIRFGFFSGGYVVPVRSHQPDSRLIFSRNIPRSSSVHAFSTHFCSVTGAPPQVRCFCIRLSIFSRISSFDRL